jgi:hypothetical protein
VKHYTSEPIIITEKSEAVKHFVQEAFSENKEDGMSQGTKGLKRPRARLLNGKKLEEIVGSDGLLKQLSKALLERANNAGVDASSKRILREIYGVEASAALISRHITEEVTEDEELRA